jgi:hypothetical protein
MRWGIVPLLVCKNLIWKNKVIKSNHVNDSRDGLGGLARIKNNNVI